MNFFEVNNATTIELILAIIGWFWAAVLVIGNIIYYIKDNKNENKNN